jgi:hypothetical protein
MALAAPASGAPTDARAAAWCARVLEFAEQAVPLEPHRFRLCGELVSLRVAGRGFEERLTRALRHAGVGAGGGPALQVFAVDARAADSGPPPGWPLPYTDRRHLERLHVTRERRVYMGLNEDTRTWHVFDRERRLAAIWTEDAARLPEWEHAFPLRTLLNWLLAATPASLAHGAVVCAGERGLLLAGAGGSGKSTTTAACLEAGLETCGDDFVAVSPGATPRAHALFDTLKLDAASLARFPRLAARVANPETGAKARIHLSELLPSRLRASCSLEAIVVPRLVPGEPTRCAPLAKTAALRALAPSTLFLTRGAESETAAKLAALVRRLPTHELRIGGPPAEAAACLRGLLERPSR